MRNPLSRLVLPAAMAAFAVAAAAAQPTAPEASAIKTRFLIAPPIGGTDVVEAKKTARTGERVVVRGKIGGSPEPFTGKRAVFTVVDVSLPSCDQIPGDSCPTPWDYCCEPAKDIAAKSATIQFAGPDGKPLKEGVKGLGGLDPLKIVTVAGTVRRTDNKVLLIVNADEVFVEGGPAAAPAGLFHTEEPENAQDFTVISTASPGEPVVFRARVSEAESPRPFEQDRALFRVTDPNEPGHLATVRVLGPDGEPLRGSAEHAGGLEQGREVVIVGTLSKEREGQSPVIDATGIWVSPSAN